MDLPSRVTQHWYFTMSAASLMLCNVKYSRLFIAGFFVAHILAEMRKIVTFNFSDALDNLQPRSSNYRSLFLKKNKQLLRPDSLTEFKLAIDALMNLDSG